MTALAIVALVADDATLARSFTPTDLHHLRTDFDVTVLPPGDDAALDAVLPEAFAVIGQPDLPRERLERAGALRVLCNVEGNFFPNVDYPTCFERGVRVLGCGPVYAQPAAEYALGLALDLCRGITREDRQFRAGIEAWAGASTADSILLGGADVGLLGFGNLGRALLPLLQAFHPTLRVHDPWLPDAVLREHHVLPATLDETLAASRVLFMLATVTAESEHLLGPAQFDLVPAGARLVLASRAAVVDFDALLDGVATGRFLAAVDVWPEEPLAADHRARALEGLVLSAHRAGGIPSAFAAIGGMVLDDLRLIAAGLPPVRMQVAEPELVGRYRNRPAT